MFSLEILRRFWPQRNILGHHFIQNLTIIFFPVRRKLLKSQHLGQKSYCNILCMSSEFTRYVVRKQNTYITSPYSFVAYVLKCIFESFKELRAISVLPEYNWSNSLVETCCSVRLNLNSTIRRPELYFFVTFIYSPISVTLCHLVEVCYLVRFLLYSIMYQL